MAGLLPKLDGGERSFRKVNTTLAVLSPEVHDGQVRCYGTQVETVRTREVRYYNTRPHVYVAGDLVIHALSSAAEAKAVMSAVRHGLSGCEGRSQDDDTVLVLRRIAAPRRLGSDRIAYQVSHAGYPTSRAVVVAVREGRRILWVSLSGVTLDVERSVSWTFKRRNAIAAMQLLQA